MVWKKLSLGIQYIGLTLSAGGIFGAALALSLGQIISSESIFVGIAGAVVGLCGVIWEDRYNWMCYMRNSKKLVKRTYKPYKKANKKSA